MVKRQVVTYIHNCDVCGEVIPDDEQNDSAQKVSVQGVDYIIELCSIHRPQFAEALTVVESFASKGQRVGGRKVRAPSVGRRPAAPFAKADLDRLAQPFPTTVGRSKDELQAIRRYARLKGMKVSDRGRIPAEIIDAYDREGKEPIPEPAVAESNGVAPVKPRRGGRKTAAALVPAPHKMASPARANPIARSPRASKATASV